MPLSICPTIVSTFSFSPMHRAPFPHRTKYDGDLDIYIQQSYKRSESPLPSKQQKGIRDTKGENGFISVGKALYYLLGLNHLILLVQSSISLLLQSLFHFGEHFIHQHRPFSWGLGLAASLSEHSFYLLPRSWGRRLSNNLSTIWGVFQSSFCLASR